MELDELCENDAKKPTGHLSIKIIHHRCFWGTIDDHSKLYILFGFMEPRSNGIPELCVRTVEIEKKYAEIFIHFEVKKICENFYFFYGDNNKDQENILLYSGNDISYDFVKYSDHKEIQIYQVCKDYFIIKKKNNLSCLTLLKTGCTKSGFAGFKRNEFLTLCSATPLLNGIKIYEYLDATNQSCYFFLKEGLEENFFFMNRMFTLIHKINDNVYKVCGFNGKKYYFYLNENRLILKE